MCSQKSMIDYYSLPSLLTYTVEGNEHTCTKQKKTERTQ